MVQTLPHILVVEDDTEYLQLVTRILQSAGFSVTGCGNFGAAVRIIDGQESIDLLLSDIGMPAGTPHGLSIAKVAQFRRPGLKVLYMTGGQDVTEFAQFAPGERVLMKPFLAADLILAVRSLLT